MHQARLLVATTLTALHVSCSAFLAPPSLHLVPPPTILARPSIRSTSALRLFNNNDDGDDDSSIPPELRTEIYQAESKTVAAQNRPRRILTYGALTFAGVTVAFFNAFLTSLRFGEGAPSSDLSYYGFGWVDENLLWGFLFTNKIGGALGLLGAGLCGTLAEMEIRSRKENAEKIWAELQRRKEAREGGSASGSSKKSKKKGSVPQSSKRSMTGRQKKRLSALEELMMEEGNDGSVKDVSAEKDKTQTSPSLAVNTDISTETTTVPQETKKDAAKKEDKGILSTLKNFYERADSMAASQALLLNKELEDRGIIEKITDETGLKVIGKEAAAEKSKKKMEEKDDD
ncbi:hypothetical protein HJC23_001354 [Cyclotella cryptica]|uniref:Uncharacterized protein n=1 Tax=Cyclotella cryptica TaxID=29204 RepID=A0ABD3PQS6_9STRA|eukprot:CCRYP_013127-RA/>CCRYP_013127-RA protein AED:0.02 eAED:0.02 QI:147/1/1/1/1/1/2/1681/343